MIFSKCDMKGPGFSNYRGCTYYISSAAPMFSNKFLATTTHPYRLLCMGCPRFSTVGSQPLNGIAGPPYISKIFDIPYFV